MAGVDLRLAGVQPPHPHAEVEIVALDHRPEELAGARVGRIVVRDRHRHRHALVADRRLEVDALIGADQHATGVERRVVLGQGRHGRPDGDHQPHAEFVELGHHRLRVGILGRVEAVVAHRGPVEEVGDDHRQRQTPAPVLAHDLEQLLLAAVAQFALPEAAGPARQPGRVTGGIGVASQDLRGRAGGDEVVDGARLRGGPAGDVGREFDPAHCRVVPQEAVSAVAHDERDGHLGVALDEIERQALVVEPAVGALAHAVEALTVVRLELLVNLPAAGSVAIEHARAGPPEMLAFLGQQLLARSPSAGSGPAGAGSRRLRRGRPPPSAHR